MLKNNWSKKIFVFLMVCMTTASSLPIPTANAAAGDIILLWDGTEASIPAGWTCVSCAGQAFNGKFVRIVSSNPNTNGGSDTVTHTFNFSSAAAGSGTEYTPVGISNALPTDAHTHTWPATRSADASNIQPPYQNLLFIKKSNPLTVPVGVIGMFDSTATLALATSWTSYAALNTANSNNTFLRGDAAATTGGSVTHTHNLPATANSGTPSGTGNSVASVTTVAGASHTHTVGSATTSDSNNNAPSSITIIFAKLGGTPGTEADAPDGLIGFADDATVPVGWSIMTSLAGTSLSTPRLLKGSATTAGTTAGSDSHSHVNVVQTSGAASTTGSTTTGTLLGSLASSTHTHQLTWSNSSVAGNSLPAYREILLAKLKLIEIRGTVYSDEGSTVITSTPTVKFAFTGPSSQGGKTTAALSNGTYTIKIPDPGAGRKIHAWLSGAPQKAVTVTRSDGATDLITGFDLYQNRVILRHEDAGPITNSDIGVCDQLTGTVCAVTDLFFNEASGVLTADAGVRIFVWTSKTFTPGGNVSSPEIKINTSGILDAGSNTLTLTGNGTPFIITGTFTPGTSTVTYAPTGTTGVTVASTTYNNVIFNKASNIFSLTTGGITTQNGGDITITAGTLDTISGQNYPISIGGSWTNNGTFTANSNTVTFTSTSTGKTLAGTLSGSSGFYNLIFNGTAGGWSNSSAMLVNNNLTLTAGTLSGTNDIDVKGNVTGTAGVINLTGGTFTQTATGGNKSFGATTAGTNWTFSSLALANDGSARLITTNSGTGTITVSSVLTITSSTTLMAADRTWILSGSGTPAVVSGSITPSTSTFRFTGSSATSIRAANYYNLQIFPGAASVTHTLATSAGQTFIIENNLDLGGNSNATGTVITAATYNPMISVAGNITLCALTCSNQMTFTKGTGMLTLRPTGTKTWTDNNPTKQDIGVVSISSGSSTPQINLGSSVRAESINIALSHTLNMNGSNGLALMGNGTPFVIIGTFTPSTSTVNYTPTGTTGVIVAPTTYHHVTFNRTGNIFSLTTGGITTQNGGNLTITAGTLDTISGQNYPISVGGSWSNSDTFTANQGTVTFTSTSAGKTISGTMTGSSAFYNLTFNGIGGGWALGGNVNVSSILNIANGTLDASSRTITLTSNGTPFVISGSFTPSTSTVTYAPTGTTGVNVTSTTYHNVTFNKAGNIFSLVSGGITTQASGGNLTITAGTLDTISGQNYPISVGGSWSNSGTFLANSGTVTFTSTATGKTIAPGASSFNHLKFNGSGGWSFSAPATLNGNMYVQAGTLSGTSGATILGGNLICLVTCGTINFTGGTVTLRETGDLGTASLSPSWTFANLALGDGSTTETTTAQGGGTVTAGTFTINASHAFSAGSKTYVMSGSGTPFVISGTFIPGTSTFQYTSTSATNIAATTYYNLEDIPAGTVTHTLAAGTLSVGNNLLVGNGTNVVTATANTNNPVIAVTGNLTIAASAIFIAPPSSTLSVGGNWSNSGTFTNNSGTVTFNGTGTKTITRGASEFYSLVFSGAGTWSFTGTGSTSLSLRSFNITNTGATVTGVSGTTTMVGDWGNVGTYNHNNGTVLFTNSAVTSNVTGATTFKNLTATEETKTLLFEPNKRTRIAGVITVGGSSPTHVCAFPVNLFSAVDGSKWEIEILAGGSASIEYAYVKDSNAITTAITANNTFKSGVNANWLGTGCLPKLTSVLPSPLEGTVGSVVSFVGSDFDANSTAIVQWGAKDSASLNDTTATIKTDSRGKFQADVAGYERFNFFIPEDEAGIHKIAVRAGGATPRTIDDVTSALDFTIKPWFWMSDFSAHVGDTVTFWGNGYVCAGIASVVRGGTPGQSTGGSDTGDTTNISLQPPPDDPCNGGGVAAGVTVDVWEEVGDF